MNVAIIHKEGYRRKFKERSIEIARKEKKRKSITSNFASRKIRREGRK